MREIEFRAWNRIEKFMDSAWLIDWEHEKVCHSKHNQSDLNDCVLMQYTGLKDKNGNGKETYEGDIIQSFEQIGIVKYELGVYYVEWINEKYKSYLSDACRNGEVIGNIYENPELLQ